MLVKTIILIIPMNANNTVKILKIILLLKKNQLLIKKELARRGQVIIISKIKRRISE